VQIKLYAIIYELIDQVKEAMAGLLEPVVKENIIGSAEVRQVFELSKGVPGRRLHGFQRPHRQGQGARAPAQGRDLRRHHAIAPPFSGRSQRGPRRMECGIRIEGYSDFQVGDAIECYAIEKVAAKL
jgi:translation initiation factor IF-2